MNLLLWLAESHTPHSHERIHQIPGKGENTDREGGMGVKHCIYREHSIYVIHQIIQAHCLGLENNAPIFLDRELRGKKKSPKGNRTHWKMQELESQRKRSSNPGSTTGEMSVAMHKSQTPRNHSLSLWNI